MIQPFALTGAHDDEREARARHRDEAYDDHLRRASAYCQPTPDEVALLLGGKPHRADDPWLTAHDTAAIVVIALIIAFSLIWLYGH
jgi:hypothetical protein